MLFYLGCLSFALFFLGDINDLRWKNKALSLCFPFGFVMLIAVYFILFFKNVAPVSMLWSILFAGLAVLFLLLTLYSLFLAIPFAASYAFPGQLRPVHTHGVYTLCRHPGVLFFIPMNIILFAAFGFPVYAAFLYCILNILLVLFEDIFVFPKLLSGYDLYKKSTPFLIPNGASIRRFTAPRSKYPRM